MLLRQGVISHQKCQWVSSAIFLLTGIMSFNLDSAPYKHPGHCWIWGSFQGVARKPSFPNPAHSSYHQRANPHRLLQRPFSLGLFSATSIHPVYQQPPNLRVETGSSLLLYLHLHDLTQASPNEDGGWRAPEIRKSRNQSN